MSDDEVTGMEVDVPPPKEKASKGPNLPKGVMPENIKTQKRLVVLTNDAPTNTRNTYYSGAYKELGIDNSFVLKDFKENFKIDNVQFAEDSLTFDLVGVDAPIANALRRILIAEVPTMAVERVYISNNTSIMQDEVLAHRLGLIPIKAPPSEFQFKNKESPDEFTPEDTIVFKLHKKCSKNPHPKDDSEQERYIHSAIYSGDLEWVPQEEQAEKYVGARELKPVHDDILIMKLRPGQEIEAQLYCQKGIGKDHAKFSPVATATYRLLPEISFKEDIIGDDADELVAICPMKVFDIEDLGDEGKRAVVAKPRQCTMCRECIRKPKFTPLIQLGRVKDHFIFMIESTGIVTPRELFREAIKIMIEKATTLENQLDNLEK